MLRPLSSYVGIYTNNRIGTVTVALENEELALSAGNLHAIAQPYTESDTVRAELVPFSAEIVSFEMNPVGQPIALVGGPSDQDGLALDGEPEVLHLHSGVVL